MKNCFSVISIFAVHHRITANFILSSYNVRNRGLPVKTSQCQNVPMSKRPIVKTSQSQNVPSQNVPSHNVPSQNVPSQNVPKSKRPKSKCPKVKTNGSIYDWLVGLCCLMTPGLSKDIQWHV